MLSGEFDFYRPETVDEVVSLLAQYGEDGKLLGGGMSLVPAMNLGLARPEILISVNRVGELDYVREDGDVIRLGGATRHVRIASDALVGQFAPPLAYAASRIGDVQVRNRGTLGGSVAHADPAADYPTVLTALDAVIHARSSRGTRAIPVREFFTGILETVLEPDELLAEIEIPKLTDESRSAYQRLHRLEGAYPIANAAVVKRGSRMVVAAGSATPTPTVVDVPSEMVARPLDELSGWVGEAVFQAAGANPLNVDAQGEYQQAMARVMARRALAQALNGHV
jgi:carbon-monoxide dehydrogenase medium subunit